jgi:heat shock protein HslJ
MKNSIPVLLMGAALMSSGCQKEELLAPNEGMGNAALVVIADQLTDTRWELVRMKSGTDLGSSMSSDLPWLQLDGRNASVAGETGCNELQARYELASDQLRFHDLIYTRRHCPEVADLETEYLEGLRHTDSYRMVRDTLILQRGDLDLAWFVAR